MKKIFFFFFCKDGIHIELFTTNKSVANRNDMKLITYEKPVMQGDGSGYVLASQYVAPPTDNSYVMTMEERMEATEEAILDIYSMLGSDL